MGSKTPLILYVPGLMPKPPEAVHRKALSDSLAAGIRAGGVELAGPAEALEVYAWTERFYGQSRDFTLDAASVERLVTLTGASDRDAREARSVRRRLQRGLFRFGDLLPSLIPYFASERQRLHIRDLNRYALNADDSATRIREGLRSRLTAAADDKRPVLLIGHSMGSVICWDTLWESERSGRASAPVALFMTMGSPLGQRYVQQRLLSSKERDVTRFPRAIERWVNLAATGDMTSLDQRLQNDFARRFPEEKLRIEDYPLVNAFRLDGALNPHAEYGYLASPVAARIVVEWWRAASVD
ncbi:MAG: hypothetical protein AAFX56_13090 [Pseudomonadota bacterium]